MGLLEKLRTRNGLVPESRKKAVAVALKHRQAGLSVRDRIKLGATNARKEKQQQGNSDR